MMTKRSQTFVVAGLVVSAAALSPAALACDPAPPHIAASAPSSGAAGVPRGTAAVLRVPQLGADAVLSPVATVDGAPQSASAVVLPFAPLARPQVFREGALVVLSLDAAAPAGEVRWELAALDPLDGSGGPATLAYTVVDGAPAPLTAVPPATATAGGWATTSHGSCGDETGFPLTVVQPGAPGAVGARLWAEDGAASGDAAAPVAGGLFPEGGGDLVIEALISGVVDGGRRAEICWQVELVDAAGGLHRGERLCTELPWDEGGLDGDWCGEGGDGAPDIGDTGDTGEGAKGGCDLGGLPGGCGGGAAFGLLGVAGWLGGRRRPAR